jgi:hypothetical protein
MNGLLSGAPSTCVIRLTVSGFLLLIVQASLILIAPATADLRALARPILILSAACLAAALAGIPDPAPRDWRDRHGR